MGHKLPGEHKAISSYLHFLGPEGAILCSINNTTDNIRQTSLHKWGKGKNCTDFSD